MRLRGRVWAADAKTVVAAFERRLGTRPWLLRRAAVANDEDARKREALYELELVDDFWDAPAHGRWVDRDELVGLALASDDERDRLDRYLDELEEVPAQRPPWARPGWRPEVWRWIEGEVERLGHVVLGLEQVKQWSISSVLRVETDGPPFYFKMPIRLPLFVEEGVVTRKLAERFPAYVPDPLAIEPRQGWMLLPEFPELFDFDAPLETQQEALRRFAGLQLRAADSTDELLAGGCLDRRLDVLESQIDPLLADRDALRQLEAAEVRALRRLAPALKDICRRLDACGLPATLVHGDLHLGNVTRIDGELQYFDWTDACVAHPFIDLLSLQWEPSAARRAALLDAYLEPWLEVAPAERLREAAELAAGRHPAPSRRLVRHHRRRPRAVGEGRGRRDARVPAGGPCEGKGARNRLAGPSTPGRTGHVRLRRARGDRQTRAGGTGEKHESPAKSDNPCQTRLRLAPDRCLTRVRLVSGTTLARLWHLVHRRPLRAWSLRTGLEGRSQAVESRPWPGTS